MSIETDQRARKNMDEIALIKPRLDEVENRLNAMSKPQEVEKSLESIPKADLIEILQKMAGKLKMLEEKLLRLKINKKATRKRTTRKKALDTQAA